MIPQTACIYGKITRVCETADFVFTKTIYVVRVQIPNHFPVSLFPSSFVLPVKSIQIKSKTRTPVVF